MADTDDIQDRIRRRAHELWEREGHPHGRDADHWAQAEAEIRGAGVPEPAEKVAGSRRPKGPAAKPAGKGTRAAAESLSETAGRPVRTAAPKAAGPGTAAQKATDPKAAAKPVKTTRSSKKDGGKGATAG